MEIFQNKKKVSIITWIGGGNFGTNLQSYALHQHLLNLGYDTTIFINNYVAMTTKAKLICLYRKLKSAVNYYLGWNKKHRKIYQFQKTRYNIVEILTQKGLDRFLKNTDVFITGSDQIWNTYFGYNPFYFLDFAQGVKRISYAPSIGTTTIPEKYKKIVKEHLLKYKHIGVRELSAVSILSNLLNSSNVVNVLDPTFLLDATAWIKLSEDANIETDLPEKFILCYLIGNNDNYMNQIDQVKKTLGISNIVVIPAHEYPDIYVQDAIIYKNAGPIEFINLLNKAQFICSDSFHALAISINLSKEFIAFLRFNDGDLNSQNSRIYDLLNHYKLKDRLYSKDEHSWGSRIDYLPIQEILNKDRISSNNFLISSIES